MEKGKKRDLFGTAGKIHATYDHVASFEKLSQPLERGVAVRIFCHGSGTTFGIDLDQAIVLLGFLTKDHDEKFESFIGLYFHVGVCPFCDGDKSYVELRKIADLNKK